MAFQLRTLALGLAVSSAVLLAACGGGSDSTDNTNTGDNTENTDSNTNTGGNTGTGGNTPTEAYDKYVGLLKSNCHRHAEVQNNGAPAYTIETRSIKVGLPNLGIVEFKTELFGSTDSNCAGPVLATHTEGGNVEFGSNVSIVGQAGTVNADKVSWTRPAYGGLVSGGQITINQLVYPGNFFGRSVLEKNLLSVNSDGSRILVGNVAGTLDAEGFPTSLSDDMYFTRR